MSELSGPDPLSIRVSDADREQIAERLREAAGEGRLDLDELDQRLEATYAARTVGDLVPVTQDLPSLRPGTSGPVSLSKPGAGGSRVVAGRESGTHVAVMSGVERAGEWTVPASLNLVAFWGGIDLDMREATFAAREIVVTATSIMGGIQITVDEHTRVVMEGMGVMGGFSGPSRKVPEELDEDSVTVRVRGVAVMGGVMVSRKERPLPPAPPRHQLH